MSGRQQFVVVVAAGLVTFGTFMFSIAAGFIVLGLLVGALAITSEF